MTRAVGYAPAKEEHAGTAPPKPNGKDTAADNPHKPDSAPDPALVFPEEAWRGPFRDYRMALRDRSEAAEAYHFASAWSVWGAALERRVYFPYFGKVYPNTYIVPIGPTGDHKTSAERLAVGLAESAGQRVIRGGGSGEGLADDLQSGPALVFIEELSTLLRPQRWEGATLGPMLTEVFDCPPRYERSFRKKGIYVERPTMSLLSASTPEWFWQDARDVDLRGGLGNRILFFDGQAQAEVPLPGLVDVGFVRDLCAELRETPETQAELTADAAEQWKLSYRLWREKQKKLDPLEAAMTKRLDVYTLKLAELYARLEDTLPLIEEDQLSAAILVVGTYAAGVVRRLIEQRLAGSTVAKDMESRILGAIKRTKTPPTTKRYLQQTLSKYMAARDFNYAFEALERSEVIVTDHQTHGRTLVWLAE